MQCLKPTLIQYSEPTWCFWIYSMDRKSILSWTKRDCPRACVCKYLPLSKLIIFFFPSKIQQSPGSLCSCWVNAHWQKLVVSTIQPIFHKQKGQDLFSGTLFPLQLLQMLLLQGDTTLSVTHTTGKVKSSSFLIIPRFSISERPVVLLKAAKSSKERSLKSAYLHGF